VTDGAVPTQNVFKAVLAPSPESVGIEYVGVRLPGAAAVIEHEAAIVVDTVKLEGTARAPAESATK
jgi:hypothetical protein